MKKIVFLFLFMFIFIPGANAGIYNSNEYGFSVELPDGWREIVPIPSNIELKKDKTFTFIKGNTVGVLKLMVIPQDSALASELFKTDSAKLIDLLKEKSRLLNPAITNMRGENKFELERNYITISADIKSERSLYKFYSTSFPLKDGFLTIQITSNDPTSSHVDLFNRIINSVRLLRPEQISTMFDTYTSIISLPSFLNTISLSYPTNYIPEYGLNDFNLKKGNSNIKVSISANDNKSFGGKAEELFKKDAKGQLNTFAKTITKENTVATILKKEVFSLDGRNAIFVLYKDANGFKGEVKTSYDNSLISFSFMTDNEESVLSEFLYVVKSFKILPLSS